MPEIHDLGAAFPRFERTGHLAWCTIDGIKKAAARVNGFEEPTALIIPGTGDVFAPGGELHNEVEASNPGPDDYATPEKLRSGERL